MRRFVIPVLAVLGLLCSPAFAMAKQPGDAAYAAAVKPKKPERVRIAASPASPSTPAVPAASTAAPGQLTTTQVQQNPIVLLQAFSVSDLQSAISLAQAQNPPDTAAVTCYQAVLTIVQSNQLVPSAPSGTIGAFTGLQMARDAKATALNLLSPTGPLTGLANACAPLILDAQNTLVGLGVTVGLVANPVGGTAAVAGLPAAVAAFLAGLPKL